MLLLVMFLLSLPLSALILEEIGIDCNNKDEERKMFEEALSLHLSTLEQARQAFGEENVQTAKHYGNLGRLFQSMKRYEVRVGVSLFLSPQGSQFSVNPLKSGDFAFLEVLWVLLLLWVHGHWIAADRFFFIK